MKQSTERMYSKMLEKDLISLAVTQRHNLDTWTKEYDILNSEYMKLKKDKHREIMKMIEEVENLKKAFALCIVVFGILLVIALSL